MKNFINRVKAMVSCKASAEGGCLLRRFPLINEKPFLAGFISGGIATVIILMIIGLF